MTILLSFKNALQIQSNCFYPAEKLLLFTTPSSPSFYIIYRIYYIILEENKFPNLYAYVTCRGFI
jgi:hypothetical protein